MADISAQLLAKLQSAFEAKVNRLSLEAASYTDAFNYAERVGQALAETFAENLSAADLPDGRITYELANAVVRPLLEQDHALIGVVTSTAQEKLNRAAGLGLKAQAVPLDTDKVDGFLTKLSSDEYDKVKWVLDEPVKTFSRGVVDEAIRRNVEFQGKAGLHPRVGRVAEAGCCPWCAKLAGTYDYPDVPKDVYRRHANCRCKVEYDPADGKYNRQTQDVWSKEWDEEKKAAYREAKLQSEGAPQKARLEAFAKENRATAPEQLLPNYQQAKIPSEKLAGYALNMNHPKGHTKAIAFRDALGYTTDNADKLREALQNGLAEWKATAKEPTQYGQPYEVKMLLTGPNGKQATVKTAWQTDNGETVPHLVSAYVYREKGAGINESK